MDLEKLDELVLYLQVHAIERSTRNNYTTGARDYLRFCRIHNLPLDPTPQTLSRYIAYTSRFIASGPKYLTGARIECYSHSVFRSPTLLFPLLIYTTAFLFIC